MSAIQPIDLNLMVGDILAIKKYREINLTEATVRDLLLRELPLHRNPKDAIKAVKKKLHNIVASYLGDPDYASVGLALQDAAHSSDPQAIKTICTSILKTHASTLERQPYLDKFYSSLFALTGKPKVILDLACGLHPFSFPWMELPTSTLYYAYDIHQPRINLINTFFKLQDMAPGGAVQDILVEPPDQSADVAFFFKEAHRFEQRQKGCNRAFWLSLKVNWLLVSLPTSSLSGKHDLLKQQQRLVYHTLEGLSWPVTEIMIENELIFCIHKAAVQ